MKITYIIPVGLLLFGLVGCGNPSNKSHKKKENNNNKETTIVIQNLTKEKAIQSVQYHITQTRKMVTVQNYYYENVKKRKPCTQYDVDIGKSCTDAGVGAPYGYHDVWERKRKCCRPSQKTVFSISGTWNATYSKPSDEWSVELEFKDVKKTKNILSWSVSDDTKRVRD